MAVGAEVARQAAVVRVHSVVQLPQAADVLREVSLLALIAVRGRHREFRRRVCNAVYSGVFAGGRARRVAVGAVLATVVVCWPIGGESPITAQLELDARQASVVVVVPRGPAEWLGEDGSLHAGQGDVTREADRLRVALSAIRVDGVLTCAHVDGAPSHVGRQLGSLQIIHHSSCYTHDAGHICAKTAYRYYMMLKQIMFT